MGGLDGSLPDPWGALADRLPRMAPQLEIFRVVLKVYDHFSGLARLAEPEPFPGLVEWAAMLLAIDDDLADLVYKLRDEAEAVHGKLTEFYNRIATTVAWADKWHNQLEREGLSSLNLRFKEKLYRKGLFRDAVELDWEWLVGLNSDIIPPAWKALFHLKEMLGHLAPRRKRGNTPGKKDYPGLADLVYELEYTARCRGGGFTFHRSYPEKGTLIEALNLLRSRIAGNPEVKDFARYLPAPGKHPASMYESATRKARKDAKLARAKKGGK
jgi:hypothetical protein